jgi:hypothetical protein
MIVPLFAAWIAALLIATELSHDALKANPLIPIVLLWSAFIRDRSIFIESFIRRGPLCRITAALTSMQ